MKNISKFLVLALVFAFGTVSCDLDRFPQNQLEQTQAFKTVQDAQNFNRGLYNMMRGRLDNIYKFTTEVQSDWLNASIEFGNRNGSPHRMDGTFLAGDYSIRDVWQGYYQLITNINNFLDNIGRIGSTTTAEADELNKLTGEAHLMRALFYHQLVIHWAKPYKAATAGTDLGVPLVLKFDVTLRPSRATVQAVYTQILNDITEAKRLMPAGGVVRSEKLTHDSALALEARVKLHMSDWPGVVTAAQALINSARYPLITTVAGLQQMWVNDSGSETIMQVFASLQELGGANNIFWGYNPTPVFWRPDFVPQQWAIDIFDNADHRKAIFMQPKNLSMGGVAYNNIYVFSKYIGNPALYTGVTNYQHQSKVFRIAETYLNLAEAQFYINQDDARGTLNALRVARNLPALTSNVDLLTHIRHERFRELVGEGFRLNDLKRWGMGVVRHDPQSTAFILTGDVYEQLSVTADYPKLIWGIPTNELITNPNIAGEQNPGW
jgi:hypothetical protein